MIVHFARFCIFTVLSVGLIYAGMAVHTYFPAALPEFIGAVSGAVLTYMFKVFEG